jgi:hypothetical protein
MLEPGGPLLLVVAPSAASIPGGGKLRLNVTAQDETGQSTRPAGVTWTSSNARVAAVSTDGTVTGQTSGLTEITAYWNGVRGKSTVQVVGDAPGGPPCQGPGGGSKLALKQVCVPK